MNKKEIILKIKKVQKDIRDIRREYDMYDLDLAKRLLTIKSLEEVYDEMMMESAIERIQLEKVKKNWEKECSHNHGKVTK